MKQMIPRSLAFDKTGRCIAAGIHTKLYPDARKEVVRIPTDHYDFIGMNPVGMTLEEIEQNAKEWEPRLPEIEIEHW